LTLALGDNHGENPRANIYFDMPVNSIPQCNFKREVNYN